MKRKEKEKKKMGKKQNEESNDRDERDGIQKGGGDAPSCLRHVFSHYCKEWSFQFQKLFPFSFQSQVFRTLRLWITKFSFSFFFLLPQNSFLFLFICLKASLLGLTSFASFQSHTKLPIFGLH